MQSFGLSLGRIACGASLFKTLVLGALYNLSDDQIEYQVRDRLSFMKFLGLGLEDRVPDAKTIWLYREELLQAGVVEALFEQFDGYLARQGYLARGGQILDASIVAVPKNRNTREESEPAHATGSIERANVIKSGEVPEDWADKLTKRSQKDTDARWTRKHGKPHYGNKTTSTWTASTSWSGVTMSAMRPCTTAVRWITC